MLISFVTYCQTKKLPDIDLKTIDGTTISASTITNGGAPLVLIFWSTTCHHTINGLDEISDLYIDWQEETNVKVVIISTDDRRSSGKVPSFVNGKGWEFECYVDDNGEFRRAMNVLGAPHLMILDANLEIIFNQSTYNIGDEEVIYKYISNQ